IRDEKWTPGIVVGMLPNGPPDGRPGFGSQVSNWLGAPHSQRRMTFFSAFLAAAAKSGLLNKPEKLVTAAAPDAARPLRNSRRWNRCSLGVQRPGVVLVLVIVSNGWSRTPGRRRGPKAIGPRPRPAVRRGPSKTRRRDSTRPRPGRAAGRVGTPLERA